MPRSVQQINTGQQEEQLQEKKHRKYLHLCPGWLATSSLSLILHDVMGHATSLGCVCPVLLSCWAVVAQQLSTRHLPGTEQAALTALTLRSEQTGKRQENQ